MKISVALAVFNEEKNIHYAVGSTIDWADEIVIVDGGSTDKTIEKALSYGKKVKIIRAENNPKNFHINKQLALENCRSEWILQLDADEAVSEKLKDEILKIIKMSDKEIEEYQDSFSEKEKKLFLRHQRIIFAKMKTQQKNRAKEEFAGFFIPRLNYFLGKFMRYGGLYPDAPIRLVKKGKAYFPCKDVHEVIEVKGRIGWLKNPLLHYDSPTFSRYIKRNKRYIIFLAGQYERQKLPRDLKTALQYLIFKPFQSFFQILIRHKGILDGWRGVVWAFFSSLVYSRAYLQYLRKS